MVDLTKRPKKVAVALVTAGVVTLGGTATAVTLANADPTPTPTPAAPSGAPSGVPDPGHRGPGGPGGRAGHGPMDGALAKELASKLGVSEAKVTSALEKVRTDLLPTAPKAGERPDPAAREAAVATALAKELGIDEAKVTQAFADIRAAHEADEAKGLQTRLDAAVKAGTLTRAEADAVLKAAKAGVIGYGHR